MSADGRTSSYDAEATICKTHGSVIGCHLDRDG